MLCRDLASRWHLVSLSVLHSGSEADKNWDGISNVEIDTAQAVWLHLASWKSRRRRCHKHWVEIVEKHCMGVQPKTFIIN